MKGFYILITCFQQPQGVVVDLDCLKIQALFQSKDQCIRLIETKDTGNF